MKVARRMYLFGKRSGLVRTRRSAETLVRVPLPVELGTRLFWLDQLRAAMMLLGLLLHAATSYMVTPLGAAWGFKDPRASLEFDLLVLVIHTFRMPIFFIAAGFFARMMVSKRGWGRFARNRLTRIAGPLLVGWVILYVPIESALARAGGHDWSWMFRPIRGPLHLWFLYYLLLLYVLTWVLTPGIAMMERGLRYVLQSRARVLILALLTALTLLPMKSYHIDYPVGWVPITRILVAYEVFFVFGWLLLPNADLLPGFARRPWRAVGLGALVLLTYLGLMQQMLEHGVTLPLHLGVTLSGALVTWLLSFGAMGLFLRHLDRPSAGWKYVADASYWMYLVHLPFMLWLPVLMVGWSLAPALKILITLAVSTPVLLLSYHCFVRSTWVGETLNGKRYPRTRAVRLRRRLSRWE